MGIFLLLPRYPYVHSSTSRQQLLAIGIRRKQGKNTQVNLTHIQVELGREESSFSSHSKAPKKEDNDDDDNHTTILPGTFIHSFIHWKGLNTVRSFSYFLKSLKNREFHRLIIKELNFSFFNTFFIYLVCINKK